MPIVNSVTVTTSPTLILAEGERKAAIISNVGAVTVYLSVSGDNTVTTDTGAKSGHPLPPGSRYATAESDRRSVIVNQAIYGIASASCKVAVETIL
jgi:hypothetical protein